MKQEVHILGAGFSGLVLGVQLAERGFAVHIYDPKARGGGMIDTRVLGNSLDESAAHSLTLNDSVHALLEKLKLTPLRPSPAAKKRFIFREGKVRRWPLTPFESLVMLVNFARHWFTKNAKPHPRETLRNWGKRVLGNAATRFLLEPALQGIYAGDGQTLSATLLVGPLFGAKKSKYRGVVSFKHGMADLFRAMEKRIVELGGHLHFGQTARLEDLRGIRILATSAPAAAEIFKSTEPQISQGLAQIPTSSLLNITVHFTKSALDGFGCLVPRGENVRVLGVLMDSCIFDRGTSTASETWIYGGATDPDILRLSDDELIDLLLKERKRLFGGNELALAFRIHRWPQGLPDYNTDLEQVLEQLRPKLHDLERQKRIYVLGNYLGGIGLSKILDRAEELIERLVLNEKGWHSSE